MINLFEERNNLYLTSLKPKLKILNFKGSGVTLHRKLDGIIQIFNFQSSSWNNDERVRIYLNLGILFPIENLLKNTKPKLLESMCQFGIRVNTLTGRNSQYNFTQEESQFRKEINLLIDDFDKYVIPFFNEFDNLESCLNLKARYPEHWQDVTPFIALTMIRNNQRDEGEKLLNSFLTESNFVTPSYREYLINLREELNKLPAANR